MRVHQWRRGGVPASVRVSRYYKTLKKKNNYNFSQTRNDAG